MTIKKYYNNDGSLRMIGFDSLEEIFAFRNASDKLEEVPSNEFKIKDNALDDIQKDPKFKEFKEKIDE